MRIITGSARGTTLKTLPGEETRPTAERVKEAMFSAVQFELGDRSVLELFGGCGQLSLEALSRGAESATIVDASRAACEIIKENAVKTKLFDPLPRRLLGLEVLRQGDGRTRVLFAAAARPAV